MDKLIINVFGTPKTYFNDKLIIFPYKKAEALFYYIALEGTVSRNQALVMLWPDYEEKTAKKNLRNAIYTLKKTFDFEVFSTKNKNLLELNRSINIENDYEHFINGDLDNEIDTLMKEFYVRDVDTYEEWLENKRSKTKSIYLNKLYNYITSLSYDNISVLESYVYKYLSYEPLEEKIYCILLKGYYYNHLYNKGIKLYEQLKKLLNEEVGISPDKEVTDLYYKIINTWSYNSSEVENEDIRDKTKNLDKIRLKELKQMNNFYENFKAGYPVNIMLEGSSGRGKSYLINTFLENNNIFYNNLVLEGSCIESGKNFILQFWNIVLMQLEEYIEKNNIKIPDNYIKTVCQLFPTFCLSEKSTFEISFDIIESNKFIIGRNGLIKLLKYLAQSVNIIIVVEDIQYIDRLSLEILIFLIKIMSNKIMVIISYKENEDALIYDNLNHLLQYNLLEKIHLYDISKDEMTEFIENIYSDLKLNDDLINQIYIETKGNIYYVMQLLEEYKKNSRVTTFSVKEIMEKKIRMVSVEAQHLLDIISIFLDCVSINILSKIFEQDLAHILDIIFELRENNLIKETIRNHHVYFKFSSSYLKDFVYDNLASSKKRMLHNRAGYALEQEKLIQDGNMYKRLIYHFNLAGNEEKVLYYKILSLEDYISIMYDIYPIRLMETVDIFTPQNEIIKYMDDLETKLHLVSNSNIDSIDEFQSRLYYCKSCYYVAKGVYDKGIDCINAAFKKSFIKNNLKYKLNFYRILCYYGIQVSDLDILKENLDKGIIICNKLDSALDKGVFLRIFALFYIMTGEFEKSIDYLLHSIELFNIANVTPQTTAINIAASYNYWGEAYRKREMFSKAIELYQCSIKICTENRCPQNATFYTNLARSYMGLGEEVNGYNTFLEANKLYDNSSILVGRAITKSYMAVFAAMSNDFTNCILYLRQALRAAELLGSPSEKGIYYLICSMLLEHFGEKVGKELKYDADYYYNIAKDTLKDIPGVYEIDNLYIEL